MLKVRRHHNIPKQQIVCVCVLCLLETDRETDENVSACLVVVVFCIDFFNSLTYSMYSNQLRFQISETVK